VACTIPADACLDVSLQFTKGDDVRIYNRALSAAEVQALYNAEK